MNKKKQTNKQTNKHNSFTLYSAASTVQTGFLCQF